MQTDTFKMTRTCESCARKFSRFVKVGVPLPAVCDDCAGSVPVKVTQVRGGSADT